MILLILKTKFMKNFLISTLALIVIFVSCKNNKTDENNQNSNNSTSEIAKYKDAKLVIYYFHATNRCPTCNSVENNVKEVLQNFYSNELDNDQIIFKSLNFEEKENEELVKKYQIAMSTLLFIYDKNQKEETSDLTNIAFTFSRSDPQTFKNILNDTIQKLLKINN